jgi:hypothetical protein
MLFNIVLTPWCMHLISRGSFDTDKQHDSPILQHCFIPWVFASRSLLAALALSALLLRLGSTSRLSLLLRLLSVARNEIQHTVRALLRLERNLALSYL